MFCRTLLVAILAAVAILAVAAALPQTPIPSTPAGQTLQAWLTAFNSADRAQVDAYVYKYDPKNCPERMMSFHSMTGGFEPV